MQLKPFRMSNFLPKTGFYLFMGSWCIESIRGNEFTLKELSNQSANIILFCVVILVILDLIHYFSDDKGEND